MIEYFVFAVNVVTVVLVPCSNVSGGADKTFQCFHGGGAWMLGIWSRDDRIRKSCLSLISVAVSLMKRNDVSFATFKSKNFISENVDIKTENVVDGRL